MSNYHDMPRFSVKPEQLAAVQEKVKRMEAEGRRLDGNKPLKSWQELRNENHELQKKLEQAEDIIDDYKRRYHEARAERLALTDRVEKDANERSALQLETECLKTDIRNACKVVELLCEIICHLCPEFENELRKETKPGTTKAERAWQWRKANKDKVREYNRRYYEEHKAAIAERRKRSREARMNASE